MPYPITASRLPVTFTRNKRGICRCEHSSMKCVAFKADCENRIPLFATMPTECPWMWAKPCELSVTMAKHRGGCTYSNYRRTVLFLKFPEPASVNDARYDVSHVERLSQVSTNDSMEFFCRM
jgi:hypothetical protein